MVCCLFSISSLYFMCPQRISKTKIDLSFGSASLVFTLKLLYPIPALLSRRLKQHFGFTPNKAARYVELLVQSHTVSSVARYFTARARSIIKPMPNGRRMRVAVENWSTNQISAWLQPELWACNSTHQLQFPCLAGPTLLDMFCCDNFTHQSKAF